MYIRCNITGKDTNIFFLHNFRLTCDYAISSIFYGVKWNNLIAVLYLLIKSIHTKSGNKDGRHLGNSTCKFINIYNWHIIILFSSFSGNGTIEFEEFKKLMKKRRNLAIICKKDRREDEVEMRQAFSVFDKVSQYLTY